MSVQALSWVLDESNAEKGDRLVLISLANHAHKDGTNAYPTVRTIAHEARMSERTVQSALNQSLQGDGTPGCPRAIECMGEGPNGARMWRVCMDDRARAFRTSKRKTPSGGGAKTAPPQPAAAAPSQVAPPRVQPTAETPPQIAPLNHPVTGSSTVHNHPPQPPQGGVPRAPIPLRKGERGRAQYRKAFDEWLAAMAVWAPCPGPVTLAGWQACATFVQGVVGESAWANWLDGIHVHAYGSGRLILASSEVKLGWVSQRYPALLTRSARDTIDPAIEKVEFVPCQRQVPTGICLSAEHPHPHQGEAAA